MRRLLLVLPMLLAGCPEPPQYRVVRPGITCGRATRVAYRTLQTLGYTVTDLKAPSPAEAGRIDGTKTGPDGKPINVGVHITCDGAGAVLTPIEPDVFPNWEFSRAFGYSFKTLVQLSEEDLGVPRAASGLEVLVHALSSHEALLDLGTVPTTPDAQLVRVTIRNNTDRAVKLAPAQIGLVSVEGDAAAPLAGSELEAAFVPGAAGDPVRRDALGSGAVAPHTTKVGYLVFPFAKYREARISVEDAETGETEGFVTPVR